MTRSMQLAGVTRKGNISGQLLLCGVVVPTWHPHVHQGEAITAATFHTGTGVQIKMSLFTCNCAVTDPKAELLPFKSHLAKTFAIKIVTNVTSPGTSHLCIFSLCVCG